MALKLIRNGEAGHLQDHNLLKNLELENQHPIKSITGLRVELDSKALESDVIILASDLVDVDVRVKEIERKIEDGEIGGGSGVDITPMKFKSTLEYDGSRLIKETFTGDMTKTVHYDYDVKDNVIKKTVKRSDGTTAHADYTYDDNNNLVHISDNGVESIGVIRGSGGGGGSIDISPLVDRVKVLEQNITILDNNNKSLREALVVALSRLTDLAKHIEEVEFTVDESNKNTSKKECSFTDALVNGDNIESLVNCSVNSSTDSIK